MATISAGMVKDLAGEGAQEPVEFGRIPALLASKLKS